jgi:hypothetical protein
MTKQPGRDKHLQRITARYVAEWQAGKQPRLSAYLERYPQYVQEITDFVAYYHAIEANVPPLTTQPLARLSNRSQAVLRHFTAPPPTLLCTTSGVTLTIQQLADQLDLGTELVLLLEQRLLDPESFPDALYRALASCLGYTEASVRAYFESSAVRDITGRQFAAVAETSPVYPEHRQELRIAIEASQQLTKEQKRHWLALLAGEEGN